MRLLLAWLVLVVATLVSLACEITNTNTNTNTGGQGGQGSSGSGVVPTPSPPTSPTSSRTPDPPAGGVLPLPIYGAAVASTVSTSSVITSCVTSTYLDMVLAALKARDTRWGRVCQDGPACTVLSRDAIGYHARAGPDVTGALGAWVVDLIRDLCTAPVAQWLVIGYDPAKAMAF
jgi:hypothetical protein